MGKHEDVEEPEEWEWHGNVRPGWGLAEESESGQKASIFTFKQSASLSSENNPCSFFLFIRCLL